MKPIVHIKASDFSAQYPTYFKKSKRNKYGAKKVIIGSRKFDSASEGSLYAELALQLKAGLIQGLETQVKEEMWAYGKLIFNYYVDFIVYHNDGTREYIEHKGMATDLWRAKWKFLLAKYDKEISRGEVKCSINWYRK